MDKDSKVVYEQNVNISKDTEKLKRNHKEILKLKSTNMKNSLDWFKSRFKKAEERIRKFEIGQLSEE